MTRWCLALCVTGLALGAPGWAFALDVDTAVDTVKETTQPVTSTVTGDDPLQPVKDAIEPVLDPVKQPTAPVRKIVDDVVKPIVDSTDDATKPVRDIVDPVVDTVVDPDLGGGGTSAPDPSRRTRSTKTRIAPSQQGAPRVAAAPVVSVLAVRGSIASLELRADPGGDAVASLVTATADDPSLAETITDAGRRFSFPLAVAAAVLLFLAVQNRVDAADPRLAAAPDDDELMFA